MSGFESSRRWSDVARLPQIDDYATGPWLVRIAGLKQLASRSQFYIGLPNTLMIAVLFYNDSPAVRSIFPTVYWWLGFIVLVFIPGVLAMDYSLVWPLEIKFKANHTQKSDRSPLYDRVMENQEKLNEILDEGRWD